MCRRLVALVLAATPVALGHGSMNMPLTRASKGQAFDPADPAYCASSPEPLNFPCHHSRP